MVVEILPHERQGPFYPVFNTMVADDARSHSVSRYGIDRCLSENSPDTLGEASTVDDSVETATGGQVVMVHV